ncbi:hypothetical protein [Microcoleus sp. FACHB-672]|uniref:hypothetical protein n=1 Tax=Microcoleus sp. FACHB-672 TaxID=2692825 RepID=UPI001A7E8EA0|nr:hypothetical protein [Microcoleus sp. FACHB-672]
MSCVTDYQLKLGLPALRDCRNLGLEVLNRISNLEVSYQFNPSPLKPALFQSSYSTGISIPKRSFI